MVTIYLVLMLFSEKILSEHVIETDWNGDFVYVDRIVSAPGGILVNGISKVSFLGLEDFSKDFVVELPENHRLTSGAYDGENLLFVSTIELGAGKPINRNYVYEIELGGVINGPFNVFDESSREIDNIKRVAIRDVFFLKDKMYIQKNHFTKDVVYDSIFQIYLEKRDGEYHLHKIGSSLHYREVEADSLENTNKKTVLTPFEGDKFAMSYSIQPFLLLSQSSNTRDQRLSPPRKMSLPGFSPISKFPNSKRVNLWGSSKITKIQYLSESIFVVAYATEADSGFIMDVVLVDTLGNFVGTVDSRKNAYFIGLNEQYEPLFMNASQVKEKEGFFRFVVSK